MRIVRSCLRGIAHIFFACLFSILMVEAKQFSTNDVDPKLLEKIIKLYPEVQALKSTTFAETFKKSILTVALERADSSLRLGIDKNIPELLEDVEKGIKQPASFYATTNRTAPQLTLLNKPFNTANNPYINFVTEGFKEYLTMNKGKDYGFGVNRLEPRKYCFDEKLPGLMVYPRPYDVRNAAHTAETLFWLFTNEYSPLFAKQDTNAYTKELTLRFLRRTHAYMDAMYVFGGVVKGQKEFLDDFAINCMSSLIRESMTIYPNFLLPTQKKMWQQGIETNAKELFDNSINMYGLYPNIDIVRAYELLNFGLLLKNEEYLKKADFLMNSVDKFVFADGAVGYIGAQNECPGYQSGVVRDYSNYYKITQNPKMLETLKKMEWYGPTIGIAPEFYTSPSWKDQWNDIDGVDIGGEPIIYVTKNPYLRGMMALPKKDPNDKRNIYKGWYGHISTLDWYRDDIKPLALPDSFTVLDRNIEGIRAQYGRFAFAGTLRDIPTNPPVDAKRPDPGHSTLIGSLIYEAADSSLKAIVMGVTAKVKVSPKADDDKGSWAWLTSGMKSSKTIAKHFSVINAKYKLHQFRSSNKGPDVEVQGEQVWLQLPDRIVGKVILTSLSDQMKVNAIRGILKLGVGGAAAGKPVDIEKIDETHYKFGEYLITLHEHSYAKVEPKVIKFKNTNQTELTWSDATSANGSLPVAYNFPMSTPYAYMVEIKPTWVSSADAKIEQLQFPNGLKGMKITVNESVFTIVINQTDAEIEYPIKWNTGKSVSKSVYTADMKTNFIGINLPTSQKIKPNEHIVLVESKLPYFHQQPWATYQDMAKSKLK